LRELESKFKETNITPEFVLNKLLEVLELFKNPIEMKKRVKKKKENADVPQAPAFKKQPTYIFTHRISIFKKHYTLYSFVFKTLYTLCL